jgi:hypothetical protein
MSFGESFRRVPLPDTLGRRPFLQKGGKKHGFGGELNSARRVAWRGMAMDGSSRRTQSHQCWRSPFGLA